MMTRLLRVALASMLAFAGLGLSAYTGTVTLTVTDSVVEAHGLPGCPGASSDGMPNPESGWVHGPANIQLYRDDGSLIVGNVLMKTAVPNGTSVRTRQIKGSRWWWTTRNKACVHEAGHAYKSLPGWHMSIWSLKDPTITVAKKQGLAPITQICKTSVWKKRSGHC